MRIAKPLLPTTTPIGLIDGFYECYKLAGGLMFIMVAMVGILVVAMATVQETSRQRSIWRQRTTTLPCHSQTCTSAAPFAD